MIILIGVALMLPSLWIGFWFDDYVYLRALDGDLSGRDRSDDLFRFFDGDPVQTARDAATGFYPWWLDDTLKIGFMRPLSQQLMRLDHALFGGDPLGYHVHSLLWWLATLVAAGAVLRRALPGAIGTLAWLLFALDESHVLPVAWAANRNALVALTPALAGLWAHLRWRQDGWRPGRVLSVLGFAIGMLGGEVALAAVAYVIAYELCGRIPAAGSRLRSAASGLAPLLVLGAVYVVARHVLDYGAAGSGIYIDPVHEPLDYLRAAMARIPALLSGGLLALSADLWIVSPDLPPILIVVGSAGFALVALLLYAIWPALTPASRCGLRWLITGGALAMLPVVATFPSERLLLASGLGIAGALAAVLHHAWQAWRRRRRWALIVPGAVLAVLHLLLAPLAVLATQAAIRSQVETTEALARQVEQELVDQEVDRAHELVLLHAPDHAVGIYLGLILDPEVGRTLPGWRLLSLAPYDHRFVRTGPRTIEMEIVGGAMMGTLFELLYRSARHPLTVGSVIDRGGMQAEVLATGMPPSMPGNPETSGPTRVAFRFDRDLDEPDMLIHAWREGALQRIEVPSPGDTLFIERTTGPVGF